MKLYNNEYLILKSFGYGIYMVEFMHPAKNNEISDIGMRAKILDLVGLNIKEIITSSNVPHRAFILTVDGIPTCNFEREQISSLELAYLEGVVLFSSEEFANRAKLVFHTFNVEHKFLYSV